jgi:Ankyrin repeats (3 copies)
MVASAAAIFLLAAWPAAASPELAEAVAKQKLSKVEKLLKPGAAVDGVYLEERTALFYAASQGDEALVGRLLDLGAKVDARDESGATPLLAAVRNPATRWSTVKALLDKGADVNVADKAGRTPLMEAVLRAPGILDTEAQVALVQSLIAAGADTTKADAAGASAMHHAAYVGEPRKVLEVLLTKAADPNAVTASGANVLMMAAQNGQRANADFLLARGFRPVRISAVAGERPPLAQDLSPRANALAHDWTAQFLTRKGDTAAAKAAFLAAAQDHAAAAAEARRLAALYELEVAKDKQARADHRVTAGLMTVLTTAATIGAGYYVIYTPKLSTKLEQDENALEILKAEAAQSASRAAALRADHAN